MKTRARLALLLCLLLLGTTVVRAGGGRPRVAEQALAPSPLNGEVGSDRRYSTMGPTANASYDALDPAVAFNRAEDEFLVVWSGSDSVIGEFEIWGQRVDADTGSQLGGDFQISFIGTPGDPDYDAIEPAVAYNSADDEYFVVWAADNITDYDYEIYGRRLDSDGSLVGFLVRISVMGPENDSNYRAYHPSVVYNSTENEYLVVWYGDTNTGSLVNGENEIWGRRLSNTAELLGDGQFRISSMGFDGDASYDAFDPDVAYNSTNNEYMVVWEGDSSAYDITDGEFEIFGQRLNASGGSMAGDFRITHVGDNNDPARDAADPAIAYDQCDNEYLVVWSGDMIGDEIYDVVGQRLQRNGIKIGAYFFASNGSAGSNTDYDAYTPDVVYDPMNNEYFIVWKDDQMGALEFEIIGQRIEADTGHSVGIDSRLSDMGTDGDAVYDAQTPAVSNGGVYNEYTLIVWSGDNSTNGEFEIWGQMWLTSYFVRLPLVMRGY